VAVFTGSFEPVVVPVELFARPLGDVASPDADVDVPEVPVARGSL
jgi:hypothetical protein